MKGEQTHRCVPVDGPEGPRPDDLRTDVTEMVKSFTGNVKAIFRYFFTPGSCLLLMSLLLIFSERKGESVRQ